MERHVNLLTHTSFLSGALTRKGAMGREFHNQTLFIMLLSCAL
jgi:hypothetical protein